ncbi:hypothetical protein [uncultured Capnocytophaga sp.]|uniref:hypothetical protein n=1 Tax=uncultured Capnocytophaga sp. TaxID=159273 RepID=UPI0026068387|nr:hypothetical protein [uncultured Capnocytophaga sp.]
MELKKTIENLWITKLLVEGLNKAFAYNEYLGCFLMITIFCIIYVLIFPIILVALPILGLVNLFRK